jgi:hypothetical protein
MSVGIQVQVGTPVAAWLIAVVSAITLVAVIVVLRSRREDLPRVFETLLEAVAKVLSTAMRRN